MDLGHPLLSPPTSSFRLSLTLHILSRSFLRFKYKPVLDTLKTQEHDINMPPSASYYPGRVHPASLIPVSEHHPDFLWLMNQRVTEEMVDHIVSKTCTTIPLASDAYTPRRRPVPAHSALPSPPVTPTKPGFQADADRKDVSEDQGIESLPSLEAFLKNIVTSSKVQAPTLLCTLIYLDRIQPRLPPLDPSAPHSRSRDVRYRVLLATIICAAKYLNDSSPKNKHWAAYSSSMFHCEDVNAMETQLLDLLGWELRLTEEECVRTFSVFFKKSPEGRAYQPPSPQEESDISSSALRSGSQLLVPANRRASRPARIEVSTGPAHLHSSYSRAQVSAAPLSPPPSAVNSTFIQSRCPPASDVAVVEETGKLGPIKPLLLPRRNGSYSHKLDSQERSSQGVRSLIPTRSSSTQRPSEAGAEKCSVDSSISWPSLSRANGILERVWGSAAQNGRDSVRSSRSVGGVFRAASEGERPSTRA